MAKSKPPQAPRVQVNAARFHEHLSEQIGYLESSCDAFDQGRTAEFKRIATAIRTLVHDTGISKSLLGHLDEKGISFLNSAFPYDPRNLLTHHGLIGLRMGPEGATYSAHCRGPHGVPFPPTEVSFDDWWSETIIKDGTGRKLTRRELVLIAANQDGGAHVDGDIDETYEALARENSLGWVQSDGRTETPLQNAEAQSIRQIGWETLQTLKRREAKLVANAVCSCGSGRKHRYCCGKGNSA